MRGEAACGRGHGPDALAALSRHLHAALGLTDFFLRPSARNPRAVRAYEKAGFRAVPMTREQEAALYGPGDYDDGVILFKRLSGS
jgi:RimJ/RimL family protein N-acetyltransferase